MAMRSATDAGHPDSGQRQIVRLKQPTRGRKFLCVFGRASILIIKFDQFVRHRRRREHAQVCEQQREVLWRRVVARRHLQLQTQKRMHCQMSKPLRARGSDKNAKGLKQPRAACTTMTAGRPSLIEPHWDEPGSETKPAHETKQASRKQAYAGEVYARGDGATELSRHMLCAVPCRRKLEQGNLPATPQEAALA